MVIATDGLNTHSFQWNGLYALRVPMAKRKAIADASAPDAIPYSTTSSHPDPGGLAGDD